MASKQTEFRAALLDPDAPIPSGLTDAAGTPTRRRFAVYRNNVTVALMEALRAGFPVLRKLLGDQNFDQLARLFVRAHPPTSPVLMWYGDGLPRFLDGFQPLAHIKYLPDVARLELALRRSYHAADTEPLAPERLGCVPPEELMRSTVSFTAPVVRVNSRWPLFDIWRFNTVDGAPKPRHVAQPVLVTRPEFDPVPHAITPAQMQWLQTIGSGQTIEAALDAATATDPEFDLGPLLSLLVQQRALATLTTPEGTSQ
ncbi:MAG: putative DNA-binding domain-containing protein [Tateyamaria sp.]